MGLEVNKRSRQAFLPAVACAIALAGFAFATPAHADWRDALKERIGETVRDGRTYQDGDRELRVSLDEAVRRVRKRADGKVIKAQTRGGVHHVKVLRDDGRVRTYRVDGATGDIS